MNNVDTPTTTDARRRYPSDLTDEQWRRVAKIIDPHELTSVASDTASNNSHANHKKEIEPKQESSPGEEPSQEQSSQGRGRPRVVSMREVVNAMNYRWRTGCTWRMLPHDFPAWATVYAYFRQWRRDGRLPELRALLLERETVLEKLANENAA